MINKRRKARELALQAHYAQEMTGDAVEHVAEDMILGTDNDEHVKSFARTLLLKSVQNKQDIDKYIIEKAHNWEFDRIAVLDKIIMRIAISEFIYFEDIPPKVSIDEAIEIAKKYSTEKSGPFINGVLDGILINLKQKGIIKKSGRGLTDH